MPDKQTKLSSNKKILITSSLCIIIEWYDFSLFAFLAVIFAKLYFPAENETLSIIATYSVFAVSFIFRPLGGLIFGNIGDKVGRKNALLLSIIIITVPTVLIGLLPTYGQIGITATILLIILRIGQGFSIGGERSASLPFLVEHAPDNLRGVYGSVSLSSTCMGIVVASAVISVISSTLSNEQFISWGWRIPFLLGLANGIVAYYLRRNVKESKTFTNLKKSGNISTSPIKEALSNSRKELLLILGITISIAVPFYIVFIYIIRHAVAFENLPISQILQINTINLFLITLFIPVFGYISDKIGRKPVLIIGCFLSIITSYLFFPLFSDEALIYKILIQLCAGITMAIVAGTAAPYMVESLPARIRMSGLSLGHVIGFSVFGGSAPLAATYMIKQTGDPGSPGIYLTICCAISLIASLFVKETFKNKIS
jgi:MHS family proline/betaine transporter-like MFS transporter